MNLNDLFFVHPSCSLRFAGRWGTLAVIQSDFLMPYGLVFEGDTQPYFFSREELLSEVEFERVQTVPALFDEGWEL